MTDPKTRTINLINKFYRVEVLNNYTLTDAENAYIIKIIILFIPRQESEMSPELLTIYADFTYYISIKKLKKEYVNYQDESDMPLLRFINGENYLTEYTDELIEKEIKEIMAEIKNELYSSEL